MRGSSGRQTLVMVNGKSMRDLVWTLGAFWEGLPVDMIERVEIIRGPGSAMYGADASSGVINIITKTAGRIESTEVAVRVGSYNTKALSMQYGGNWDDYETNMTAEFSRTDGHDPFIGADFQTRLDPIFSTSVSTAPGNAEYDWKNMDVRFSIAKDHWRVHADYIGRRDVGIGLTGAGVLDAVSNGSDNRYGLDWFYQNDSFRKNWGLDVELRYQNMNYTSGAGFLEFPLGFSDSDGAYPDGLINHWRSAENMMSAEVSTRYFGLDKHDIRFGVGSSWEHLYRVKHLVNFGTAADGSMLPPGGPVVDISDSPFAFAPEKTRKNYYLFSQDVVSLNDWLELTAGLRYEHFNDFGNTLNPRVALVWENTKKLTTKLAYGESFRAPNYQELFAITSRSTGNPNLMPEQSKTVDLGLTYLANDNLVMSLNIFYFELTDIISRDSSRVYQNGGKQNIRGVEVEASWQASDKVRISGNYTKREPGDDFRQLEQPEQPEQPEQDGYLRFDYRFNHNWNWNVQANWVAGRRRSDTDNRPSVDDYVIADTTLRYSFNNMELAASIRNLFDEDAREHTGAAIPDDLPLPQRSAYAEFRYKF